MEIKLNKVHFDTMTIAIFFFFFLHFIHNRSDLDQWSQSKRQLHLWNTRSNQCLWLIHYKLKECCLSTCLCDMCNIIASHFMGALQIFPDRWHFCCFYWSVPILFILCCLTVYWCFATAVLTRINSVLERIPARQEKSYFVLEMWRNRAHSRSRY